MSTAAVAHDEEYAAEGGIATGFWLYIVTDCVLFATLFAVYAVLHAGTASAPLPSSLLHLQTAAIETFVLLTSSAACGLAWTALCRGERRWAFGGAIAVALLGITFLALEASEFSGLSRAGYSWSRSGALSSYFILVGTHGLHVTAGVIWLVTLIGRGVRHGVRTRLSRDAALFSIFWHFLDVVWILIFTVVNLWGSQS